ncbi:SRPBCC family protein [Flammeovirga aprica]|uniref:SRPBCC family protein n=1 Tax=Flammeovirga aprica JL-4 TaxID=694437 RepID=A0A7X9RT27_9BACT|nr:SRPBCC family protein [Flammeovirga aprica]NME67965.1 SRPBCC family protein [Flammeovirga aprica JL-4]
MKKKYLLFIALIIVVTGLTSFIFTRERTNKITIKQYIPARVDKVWAVVGEDFGGIAKTNPNIVSSSLINGFERAGEGAERVCNFNYEGTSYIHEKQVDFNPDNYSFKVKVFHVHGTPLKEEESFAEYKLIPKDANTCELIFSFQYETTPFFLGDVMKPFMKEDLKDYLVGIQHYVLTGEDVNHKNIDHLKQKYDVSSL